MIRMMRSAKHVAIVWQTRKRYKIFVGNPNEKRSLEIFRLRWEDSF